MVTGAWGMTLGGWIWMTVWIVALFVMLLMVVSGWHREERTDPLEILRARYARGELSEDEYQHARQILGDAKGATR